MKLPGILALALSLAFAAIAQTACTTAPEQRQVAQTQSLIATGQIAETAVGVAAQLFRDGRITAAQARSVMDLYDRDFQPAFRVAVAASQNNLAAATPELVSLASQIANLVSQYQHHAP